MTHPLSKLIKEEVFALTSSFPEKITYSKRIKSIASGFDGKCISCSVIHGDPDKKAGFCSQKCYLSFKSENKMTDETKQELYIEKIKEESLVKFKDCIEGVHYLTCKICGVHTQNLTQHLTIHKVTNEDYKSTYGLDNLKTTDQIDSMTGNKNPAYQHDGKFSPWSKNFINGYDSEKHETQKKQMSDMQHDTPEKFPNNIEYWIAENNGDIDLGTAAYKKWQTRDLEFFVNKYGAADGIIKHAAKTERWLDTLNSKSTEELADINSRKIRKSAAFYSKAEKELFHSIREVIPELKEQLSICRDPSSNRKQFYIYDMCFDKKIIEYNGDFWHANPLFHGPEFVNPYNNKSQCEILARDADKLAIANTNGYSIMVVWEHNYKKNKEKVIEECINFLKQ